MCKYVSVAWGYEQPNENGKHILGQSYRHNEGFFTRHEAERDAKAKLLEKYPSVTKIHVNPYYYYTSGGVDDDLFWYASAGGVVNGQQVTVKFGKPVIYDNISRETAEKIAAKGAIERLVKAYPDVENIKTRITVNEEYSRVQASASGIIYKSSKAERFIKKITIKDIFDTTFYRDIKIAIGKRTVEKYSITCYRSHEKSTGITFQGTGDIDWKGIEKSINNFNLDIFNRKRSGEKITKFYVYINSFGADYRTTDNAWEGIITLNDNSWITIGKQYNCREKEWYNGITLHNFPEDIVCDNKFSAIATINNEIIVIKHKA